MASIHLEMVIRQRLEIGFLAFRRFMQTVPTTFDVESFNLRTWALGEGVSNWRYRTGWDVPWMEPRARWQELHDAAAWLLTAPVLLLFSDIFDCLRQGEK